MSVPVSKGSEQPINTPLRTAEDTHGPEGMGYARLPSTDGSSQRMMPLMRGSVRRTNIPANWSRSRSAR